MENKSTNVVWHDHSVSREQREVLKGHKSCLLWFTGLSGAGKSTIAQALNQYLYDKGCHSYVLDGDNVRHNLCRDLSFSDQDRTENIRRIGEVARLFVDAGTLTLTAFISPLVEDRETATRLFDEGDFVEVYCRCDLSVCEGRDVKGLYKKARAGEIPHFTGISSPYEEPQSPEIVVDTNAFSIDQCVDQIVGFLKQRETLRYADADEKMATYQAA